MHGHVPCFQKSPLSCTTFSEAHTGLSAVWGPSQVLEDAGVDW